MKLNTKKTKSIIFNFTKKYQFSTKLSVDDQKLDIVKEAKLLGTHITDDLKWNKNTSEIVKKMHTKECSFSLGLQSLLIPKVI